MKCFRRESRILLSIVGNEWVLWSWYDGGVCLNEATVITKEMHWYCHIIARNVCDILGILFAVQGDLFVLFGEWQKRGTIPPHVLIWPERTGYGNRHTIQLLCVVVRRTLRWSKEFFYSYCSCTRRTYIHDGI